MNKNYLLHNATAKKLYFDYAKDLPIIMLCDDCEPEDKIYNNISEAFLLNDCYKQDAMRECGIDEKFITGNASDYEKFRAFCSILPKFAGHPIYLLAHIELKQNFDCDMEICEENADEIWQSCNSKIILNSITEKNIAEGSNLNYVKVFYPFIFNEIEDSNVLDLKSLELHLLNLLSEADKNGYKIVTHRAIESFFKPNPYKSNEILQKMIKEKEYVSYEEKTFLEIQLLRTLGIEYKKRDWTLLWYDESYAESAEFHNNEEVISYLDQNGALPKNYNLIYLDFEDTEEAISQRINIFARRNALGKFIFLPSLASSTTAFTNNDYIRRILCNVIGKWVENGEYTSDEKTLKKLIEDILYNNLKEAIS